MHIRLIMQGGRSRGGGLGVHSTARWREYSTDCECNAGEHCVAVFVPLFAVLVPYSWHDMKAAMFIGGCVNSTAACGQTKLL